ncbi:MAG: iron ABC transporter permease [Bifidobacteriaceae bacterium]|jgi:thiamine transport system permease protein|nr:iron ABC transporter permease [Bifidobacteriaceae bacterium]
MPLATAPVRPSSVTAHQTSFGGRCRAAARALAGRFGLTALAVVPIGFLAIFFAWPVITIIGRGLVGEGGLDLTGFAELFSKARTWRLLGRTVGQACLATAISAAAAIPLAGLLYRRSFPGRGLARAVLTLPFALPSVVVGLAFRSLLGHSGPLGFLGLDGSMTAVVLALVFFNVGLMTRVVGVFWAGLDPRPEQAARVLGAGPWRALATVTLPALTPAIAAGASLVFLFSATAFAPVLILGGSTYATVETEIYLQTAQLLNLRAAAVLSIVQLGVVAAALAFGARARRRRERALKLTRTAQRAGSAGSGNAGTAGRVRWRQDWPAMLVAAAAGVLVVLPLGNLVFRSVHSADGFSFHNYLALGQHAVPGLPYSMLAAAGRSVLVALLAAGIALLLGTALAVVLTRRPRSPAGRRWQEWLDGFAMLPLGVSAVTVGFGFLITLKTAPFDLRTSFWLIPLAQALVALPLVVRGVLPALRAVDRRLIQAARVLGAGPWRCFWTVEAPAAAGGAAVASAYAFAASIGEFGATTFLARPDTTTLPVAIYKLLGRPGADNLGMALAGSVLLAAITAAVMALAEWRGGELRVGA